MNPSNFLQMGQSSHFHYMTCRYLWPIFQLITIYSCIFSWTWLIFQNEIPSVRCNIQEISRYYHNFERTWFLLFWFDTAKLGLRKVGLKMLAFIICLLIKKSKEGHILCRLVHNGLKILLKQFLILMHLHFHVKIHSKKVWKSNEYIPHIVWKCNKCMQIYFYIVSM